MNGGEITGATIDNSFFFTLPLPFPLDKQMKLKAPSEAEIEMQIGHYLDLHKKSFGYFFKRQPNSGYYDASQKRFRRHANPYVRKGVPDYELVHLGRYYGLEIKAEKGRQSDEQKQYQLEVEKAGGAYAILRSLEDAKAFLATISASKPP